MSANDSKDKICLRSIAPKLMGLMREIKQTSSESLATMLIQRLFIENQNMNAHDTVKRRIYDVINVLSAAGIIEKDGKKLIWHGLNDFRTMPMESQAKRPIPESMGPSNASLPVIDTSYQFPFNPFNVPPIPAHGSGHPSSELSLDAKERRLLIKLKLLTNIKLMIQQNTLVKRPESSILPYMLIGLKNNVTLTECENKGHLVLKLPNDSIAVFESLLVFMLKRKIDPEKAKNMIQKNPKYQKYADQVIEFQSTEYPT